MGHKWFRFLTVVAAEAAAASAGAAAASATAAHVICRQPRT